MSSRRPKDYYEILNLKPTASLKDIKLAYRSLALKYHPDKNTTDPDAEAKFKKICEAYSVLGEPAERRKYDRLRSCRGFSETNYNAQGESSSWFDPWSNMTGGGEANINNIGIHEAFNIFSRFMYEGGVAETFQGDDGRYLFVDVPLDVAKTGGNVSVKTPDGNTHNVIVDGIVTGGWRPISETKLGGVKYWIVFRVDFPADISDTEKQQLQMNLMFMQTVSVAIPYLKKLIDEHPWWLVLAAGAVGLAAISLTK